MSDAFHTISATDWRNMFSADRELSESERNPVAVQIRERVEFHNPKLVMMLAIQRAHQDGFPHFAAALKTEFLRQFPISAISRTESPAKVEAGPGAGG